MSEREDPRVNEPEADSGHRHDESCRDLAARLSEYLDGELPAELARDVAIHFQACQRCEEFVESLDRVRRLGATVPVPAPTAERKGELIETLRSRIAAGDRDRPASGSD